MDSLNVLQPNAGKVLTLDVAGEQWMRLPIQTHTVMHTDDMIELTRRYAKPHLLPDDLLFISERVVAITQGRAFPIKDIIPSPLAKLLVHFVHKSPYGIGLGSPWTMELAIREAGAIRIIAAALVSGLLKPFGIKGVFYHIVGHNINAIDGPCTYTLPPYNEYAKLGPKDPDDVAKKLAHDLGCDVVIIDANDLGVAILGKSKSGLSDAFCKNVFRDNPLGQSTERTPLCIVRRVRE